MVDVTPASRFTSTNPAVVSVGPDGLCRPAGDGAAEVVVEWEGKTARVAVTVSAAGDVRPPSFKQDIEPVLTRAGCNSGACHGKLAGQNGFKLSLRGYAPEWDYDWLTKEVQSRRIDYVAPERSLIVTKPLGRVPHEGGRRLEEGSRAYRALVDWVAARTPGPDAKEPDAERIEVIPGPRTLRAGESQRLLVRAFYPDGRARDVTWVSQFFSNDPTVMKVSPDGVVTSLRPGESAVRAHFQGQVQAVLFTTPFENAVGPEQYAAKNNAVDEHVFAKLAALRIPPSPGCDDAAFARRAFLDATGALPPPERVRAFVADTDPAKRTKLVDALLASPEFTDYWTQQLCDLLQNREERDGNVRGKKGLRAFHNWVREQVAANRPWDQIAREVLTASGDTVTQPTVGYFATVIGPMSPTESPLTDSVAQSFLGTRIGCAKCHNHPLEKYTQDDYYHFAAFFSRMTVERSDSGVAATIVTPASRDEMDRRRDVARVQGELNLAMTALHAKPAGSEDQKKAGEEVVNKSRELSDRVRDLVATRARPPGVGQPRTGQYLPPRPLDRQSLGDVAAGEDPRQKLAAWMTDPKNASFSGAMVNRLWKHFMGVGLVEPVDDLRASNPPSNPALWAALNGEFVSHGYDLRHVIRLVMNSRAYQLSSRTLPGNEQDARYYSHYYARRLPAEVLLDAVAASTGVPERFPGYPVGTRAVQLPEPAVGSYFLGLFGRSERVTACACERNGDVTLPQLLHLTNGEDVLNKIRSADGRLAGLLKAHPADDARLLDEIFTATVCRPPAGPEADPVRQLLAAGEPRDEVYRDLFWALMNSKEFTFNH